MKYDLFFKLAKEHGIEECELKVRENKALSFEIFHSEIENYNFDNGFAISARGLVNGKFGSASCDVWNKEKALYLVEEIVKNASVIEDEDPMFIFKGSPKYKKVNVFNKDLDKIPTSIKIENALKLEKLIKEGDPRISEVEGVTYSESCGTSVLMNSHGLKLKSKGNIFVLGGYAVAKDGEQTKSNGALFFENDYSKLNIEELAREAVNNTVSQLGGKACASGKYKTILDRDVVSALLPEYIASCDAEEVQKHTSLFINKLNTKVASKKVTIEDRPLDKTLFATSFDGEGVATSNKAIIKNGVLKTYLYNLTTAAKDGVSSTGNGHGSAAKMGIAPNFLYLKPGKKSLDELFKEVGDGVYITEVSGLHSGLDSQTGNFSLQANGFLIKDGKKDHALDVVIVSGNLVKLFNSIQEVASDNKVFSSAVSCSSILVKSLSIGGE